MPADGKRSRRNENTSSRWISPNRRTDDPFRGGGSREAAGPASTPSRKRQREYAFLEARFNFVRVDTFRHAFVVIRNIIESMKMVAIGRVVLTSREHIIAMEPRGKGIMGTLLRYPYEVRDEKEYFDEIPDLKLGKDMMDLARHIVETKSAHFEREKFEDHYESALKELIEKKSKGIKIEVPTERAPAKVVNLMDALRRSVAAETQRTAATARPPSAKKSRKRIEGQKEMLLPIPGKKGKELEAKPSARPSARQKTG